LLFSNNAAHAITNSAHFVMKVAGFGAVFDAALKERNQAIGYKKLSGESTCCNLFLLFWR